MASSIFHSQFPTGFLNQASYLIVDKKSSELKAVSEFKSFSNIVWIAIPIGEKLCHFFALEETNILQRKQIPCLLFVSFVLQTM